MTRFSSMLRALGLAGAAGSLAFAAVSAMAQTQAPQAMPGPRYQTPGLTPTANAPLPTPVFPVTAPITPNGVVAEEVIARVNDQIITRSDLLRGEEQLQQELQQTNATPADAAERQRNLLRDLIDQQLLLSKAKELGMNPDAEVVRRLDEIRKQNNLPTMEALEEAARRQGVSFEDFKANIRNSIMTRNVVGEEVGRNIHMTRADEQKYYDQHKDELAVPEQVKLSEILVPLSATASDAEVAQAKAKADDIYAKLQGGADFAATAKTMSGGPTAAQGGDLGVFKRGQLARVLEDKTFAQAQGAVTEPIRTRQGFVILKTVEHVPAGVPPLSQVEPEIQNAMYQEAIQPALRAYLTKQREDSYVEIRPGFVDSGATGKQTKPIYVAYTQPQPKKKTVNKQRLVAQRDRARLADAGLTAKGNVVQPLATVQLDRHGKPKKVRREKVRFGQAPREALPEENAASTPTVVAGGVKAPSASGQDALGTQETNPLAAADNAAGTNGNGAPGTQLAPVSTNNTIAANEGNPLVVNAPVRKKSRFSDREPEVKEKKQQKKVDQAISHVTAKPDAATASEKADTREQDQALGLGGDTAKKKKKRQKGEAKERLQQTTPEKKEVPTDNGLPDRLHQQNGPEQTTGTQSASSQTGNLPAQNSRELEKQRRGKQPVPTSGADQTTLPPVNAPAPGTSKETQTPSETPAAKDGGTPTENPTVPPPQ